MTFSTPNRVFSFSLIAIGMMATLSDAHAADAWPEECKLQRLASLPFTIEHGHILIDVSLNGVPRHFIIDTGAVFSSVSQTVVADQKLKTYDVRDNLNIAGIGGKRTERYAVADTLTFAKLKAETVRLLIEPSIAGEDGVVAPDYLRNFDLDFDFANNTLNLFRPHLCEGHAVYWGDSYVVLAMTVTDQGHIRVLTNLDGVELEALVDTGAPASLIGARTVEAKFDLHADNGAMAIQGASGGLTTASAHRFSTLALGGLTVKSPTMFISADEVAWRSDNSSLLLGLHELRMFHVYVAYREHKMYLSLLPRN